MCPTVIGQCSAAFQQSTQVPVCAERFDHRIKFILEFLRFMLHLVIVPRGVKLFSGAVKYHSAQQAVFSGLNIIDAGHQPTELPVLEKLADRLSLRLVERDMDVVVNVAKETLILRHV